jgi:hypothetical protein
MRLRPEVAARASEPAKPQAFTFKPPAPGVKPADAPSMAQDSDVAALYGWASAEAGGEGIGWLGYPYLAELAQRPEYRRGAEIMAKEMTRKWIKLVSTGDEPKADKLKVLGDAMERFKVRDAFRRAAEIDGLFGRAQIFFDLGASSDDELATPLLRRPEKIARGSLKRLRVIEPMWTYPNDYNSSDPLATTFYRPASWFVQGRTVHASRLLTFVAREVPDMLKPAYSFGGLSLTQMAKPYVDNWLRTRQSVSDLIHSFSVSGIKTDMSGIMQADPAATDSLFTRVALFDRMRDNRGTMVLDKGTEEFFNISTPLGTLDHLQAQSQEQMASVQGIPLVVLLGITPSGLNASSDGEIRVFYAWTEAQQEDLFSDNLRTTLDVIQLSEFGEIDPEIGFQFNPLWQMDDVAVAAVRKTNAETDQAYVDMGVLGPEDIRGVLASDKENRYAAVDFTEPVPEEIESDDTAPGNPPSGSPGDATAYHQP